MLLALRSLWEGTGVAPPVGTGPAGGGDAWLMGLPVRGITPVRLPRPRRLPKPERVVPVKKVTARKPDLVDFVLDKPAFPVPDILFKGKVFMAVGIIGRTGFTLTRLSLRQRLAVRMTAEAKSDLRPRVVQPMTMRVGSRSRPDPMAIPFKGRSMMTATFSALPVADRRRKKITDEAELEAICLAISEL